MMEDLCRKECGDNISQAEQSLQSGRCKPCYARWQEENRFRDLCSLVLRAPEEAVLPEATRAVQAIVDDFKL